MDKLLDEHVWRFPLNTANPEGQNSDPMVELVRSFLEDFQNLGVLTHSGERVLIDGFSFAREPSHIHRVFPATMDAPGHRDIVAPPTNNAPIGRLAAGAAGRRKEHKEGKS